MHLPKCLERIVKTVAPLSAAALAAWPLRLPAEPPVEGHFRQLGGIVRFDNAAPAILDRLGAPGNEGMSSLTVRATSLAPDAGLAAQVNAPVPSRVANPYQLSVQAGTNAATAIAYGVQAAIWLKNDRELFYSRIVETAPLVEASDPLALDIVECVGVLRLQFVDARGVPVTIEGGSGQVYVGTELRGQVFSLTAGSSENFLVVPAGTDVSLAFQFQRGADLYHDQINHVFNLTTNVPCDSVRNVPVVLLPPASLGRITGQVDMEGEFELDAGPSGPAGLRGRTAVIATGPAGNRRFDHVSGDNLKVPASGLYELENLLPSDAVDPAQPWRVQAQMHFRTGPKFEFFTSPALGEGANPGIVVPAAGTVDLGGRLRFKRGTIRGRVHFAGPPDTAASRSALAGLVRPDDYGVDAFGIPVNSGTYGLVGSQVVATGQDVPAPGAAFTAAGGRAAANFEGKYDTGRAAFRGDYELAVGGLDGEPSVWKRDLLALSISTVTNIGTPYVAQALTVTDRAALPLAVGPDATLTADLSLGFSEVCLRFRTPGRRFHSPVVTQAPGKFSGADFEGVQRDYVVNVEAAYGLPSSAATAADSGVLTLVLPQGSYRFTPSLNVINADGTESITQLEEIQLEVPARQRICVEGCLRLTADIPPCAGDSARITGAVQTCGQRVKTVTYQVDAGPPVIVCDGCGPGAALDFTVPLKPGPHLITVTAIDVDGAVSSVSGSVGADTEAPVITCPGPVTVTADSPCGTVVRYALPVIDNCDPSVVVVCTPPSGSSFALGTTEVVGVATDAAGNRAECRFTVTVLGEVGPPTLARVTPGTLDGVDPVELSLTGTRFLRADEVWLGDQRATDVRWLEPGELRFTAPALPPGSYTVTLRRCGDVVASLAGNLTVAAGAAGLTGAEPASVPEAGNTYVTLHGRGLTLQSLVRVGFPVPASQPDGNRARNVSIADDGTALTVIVPGLPPGELPGLRSLVLEDAAGKVLSTLVDGLTYLSDAGVDDLQVVSLRKFQRRSLVPATVRMREGFPSHLQGRILVAGTTPLEQARSFARDYRQLLRVSDPDQELFLSRVEPAQISTLSLVTLAQSYRGIPVFGAEVAIHLADGEALNVLGFLLPTEELAARLPDVTPRLTAEKAEEIVKAARAPFPSVQLLQPSRLAIYDACVFAEGEPMNPKLVWRVTYVGASEELFVDAHTGQIVHRSSISPTKGFDFILKDGANRTSSLSNGCAFTFTFAADENGVAPAYAANPQAKVLFQHARDTHSFYLRHFGRDSVDGNGKVITMTMNANIPAGFGAVWRGACDIVEVFQGNEDIETIGHELTHGVIGYTSKLAYQSESGALNEHYADIMAVLMDRDLGANNWTYSENKLSGAQAVRDVANPGSTNVSSPQPSHYRDRFRLPPGVGPSATNDWGGVHGNSGIANLASYRLTAGAFVAATAGSGRSFRIAGLGEAKARQLFYWALTCLPANATFEQARDGEVFLAEFFASRSLLGFTGNDALDVREAWTSVGVGVVEPDDDGDGVPNSVDNCRKRANPRQEDVDRDGVGDVCDNCKFNPNPDQKDLDHDGIGDFCDSDRDGDGCQNAYYQPDGSVKPISAPKDWHPDRSAQVTGYVYVIGTGICATGLQEAEFSWEGLDSDRDGVPDCNDEDDDNDGLFDVIFRGDPATGGVVVFSEDPCPTRPFDRFVFVTDQRLANQCSTLGYCNDILPSVNVPPGDLKGGLFVRFDPLVDPDPYKGFLWDNVRLAGDSIILDPGAGVGVGQLSQQLKSLGSINVLNRSQARPAAPPATPGPLRVELWAHGTDGGPARLLRVLGNFDPRTADIVDGDTGAVLVLSAAGEFGKQVGLAGVWMDSQPPGSARSDIDHDGMPDGYEIRHGCNPRNGQDGLADSDGEGRRNFEEFLAGTDPLVVDAVPLRLTVTSLPDGRLRFTWAGGATVGLQRATSLIGTPWTEIQGSAGRSAIELEAADASGFFRLFRP